MKTGLTSITFRQLPPQEIVRLTARAGLDGIEWGGDVHVPPGDVGLGRSVGRMTVDAGLQVSSYGSYHCVGEDDPGLFGRIVETALALGAPVIRVWAGNQGSTAAPADYRQRLVEQARGLADQAGDAGLRMAFEFHGGSLADTGDSAARLMREIAHKAAGLYWQPQVGVAPDVRMDDLRQVQPWLCNIHTFHWIGAQLQRLPLSEGRAEWMRYVQAAVAAGWNGYALLEYVRNDAPQAFLEDAATLRELAQAVRG